MAKGAKKASDWVFYVLITVLIFVGVAPSIYSGLKTLTGDTANLSAGEIAILSICGLIVAVGFLYKIMKGSGM